MDRIEVPQDQVVSIESVAPGIHGLRIAFVNVFGISNSDGSWVLIDSGLPMTDRLIRSWAEKHFTGAPKAILLTHGHFDHASSAKALVEHWNVPIYAHPEEHPYLEGQKEYPRPNFAAGGGLMAWLSPMYPRGPYNFGDRLRALNEGPVAEISEWKVVHTPGHTPGHVSFFREHDKALIAGDAFCTTKPESFFKSTILQSPELHGPPAYFTSDWNAARASVQRLAELQPQIVAPGHGKPMQGSNLPELLSEMAARFRDVAVPENRRDSAA